jgi:hypothetical protein
MPPSRSVCWFVLPAASLISGTAAARANGTAIAEGAAGAAAGSVPGRAVGTTAEPFLRQALPIPHSALSEAAVKNGTIFDIIGNPAVMTRFDTFKLAFGRNYGTEEEEAMRFQSFEASVRTVDELNSRNGASVFGINHLSDLFVDELAAIAPKGRMLRDPDRMGDRLALAPRLSIAADVQDPSEKAPSSALPRAIDWRLAGAVTPVKTQGACGDCWAFSVVEEVESMYSIYADDSFQTFSPQQVTSCATESYGCGGGDPIDGYAYIVASPGLAQEVFWPFSGGLTPAEACSSKTCTQACNAKDLTLISRHRAFIGAYAIVKNAFFAIPPCEDPFCEKQDLQELARALVNEGPVSVGRQRGRVASLQIGGDDLRSLRQHLHEQHESRRSVGRFQYHRQDTVLDRA